MTDDIVTRLRDRVAARSEFVPEGSVGHLIYEAADEIDRLRRQIKMWIQIADHLAVVVAKHEPMHLVLASYDSVKDLTLDD